MDPTRRTACVDKEAVPATRQTPGGHQGNPSGAPVLPQAPKGAEAGPRSVRTKLFESAHSVRRGAGGVAVVARPPHSVEWKDDGNREAVDCDIIRRLNSRL